MSLNFAIDNNNGFLVEENQLVLLEDKEAIAVNATTSVQTLLGEEPFLQDVGMPNFETVWEGSPNIPDFERSLRDTLSQVNGISLVGNFIYSLNNNELEYSIDVLTTFGITTVSSTLNV